MIGNIGAPLIIFFETRNLPWPLRITTLDDVLVSPDTFE